MNTTTAAIAASAPTLAPQIGLLPDVHQVLNNNTTSFLNYLSDFPNNNNQSSTLSSTHTTRKSFSTANTTPPPETAAAANQIVAGIRHSELQYGDNKFPKLHQKEAKSFVSMMITKSDSGYYVFNNITLKVETSTPIQREKLECMFKSHEKY